jgi:dihydropteroate synthase
VSIEQDQLWETGPRSIDCSAPRVLAIVNATPDSFHADSRLSAEFLPGGGKQLCQRLAELLEAGPDIIDVGGQSTRPGSTPVGAEEELRRVMPVLELLRGLAPELPLSVDTYHAPVARAALATGACIVNDISAGSLDPRLLAVVAGSGCGYVLMHMQGTPATMQQAPRYADCVGEVHEFFAAQLERLERLGIARERVVLDPGIGFGKRLEDNLRLIRDAAKFSDLGRPLLYGISRKAFIGQLAFPPDSAAADPRSADPALRLPGTLGVSWELLSQGVMLHRVHDAAAQRQLGALWQALH